jgi:hypothetical protein
MSSKVAVGVRVQYVVAPNGWHSRARIKKNGVVEKVSVEKAIVFFDDGKKRCVSLDRLVLLGQTT